MWSLDSSVYLMYSGREHIWCRPTSACNYAPDMFPSGGCKEYGTLFFSVGCLIVMLVVST